MLLIKAGETASYDNLVNVLDEVIINLVKKYAILKITSEENNFIRNKIKKEDR
jgi:hypothetical protein